MTPKISIIIPVYNTETYLRECLDSVINQTLKDIEIIIVNDCSPDNSESIILEYLAKDPRIKYIKHDVNKSLLQARISGAKIAVGDYIFHVDSDDYLPTLDACQILANTIDKTHPDLIQFDIQSNVDWGNWFTPLSKTLIKDPQQIKDLYFNNISCSTLWSRIIKRDLYLQSIESISQDLHINMAEDFLQCSLIMNLATSYIGIDHKLYYYRVNDSSLTQKSLTSDIIQEHLHNFQQILDCLSLSLSNDHRKIVQKELVNQSYQRVIKNSNKFSSTDLNTLLPLIINLTGENTTKQILLEFVSKYLAYHKELTTNYINNIKLSLVILNFTIMELQNHPIIFYIYTIKEITDENVTYLNNLAQNINNYNTKITEISHDKWYCFGQLSRTQKIKKILIVLSKKIKIYPVLKKIFTIIRK